MQRKQVSRSNTSASTFPNNSAYAKWRASCYPLGGSSCILRAALALRPRRRGTPKRSSQVVQTQIILSIIGALVMIVVRTSLARAFGVVGAAGLVRYRAKIDDPKDAGVMLSTLAVGLAYGIGLYGLAMFPSVFVTVVLWIIESFEPTAHQ